MEHLKLLINVRPIKDIGVTNTLAVERQLCRRMESFAVGVPDLQDVEALLGADADAHDRVARV